MATKDYYSNWELAEANKQLRYEKIDYLKSRAYALTHDREEWNFGDGGLVRKIEQQIDQLYCDPWGDDYDPDWGSSGW